MKNVEKLTQNQCKKANLRLIRFLWVLLFLGGIHGIGYAGTNPVKENSPKEISQSKTISGIVIDTNNEPLIGVSVSVKGTTVGTMTGLNGDYSIIVPDSKSVLVFSFLGYQKREITVENQTAINITLSEDAELLDEVVVIGFQAQKKVNLTAAVSNVDSKTFENRPVSNIGQALQGAVPGLNINIEGGAMDKVPDLNIRGGTTMRQKSTTPKTTDYYKYEVVSGSPLIMLDGIEISAENLNQINPADIESMSVLKDASAAAIYGTRATFGVILVQTKSGRYDQKAKINYSYDISWDQVVKSPDLLDSYTRYKSLQDKSIWTGDKTAYTADDIEIMDAMQKYIADPRPENAYFMRGDNIQWVANTNPFKEMVRSWAPTQKHNVSVSGGSSKVNYNLSLGMQDKEGMLKLADNSDEQRRYNMMLSMNVKPTNWFNVGAKASYSILKYREPKQRYTNFWNEAKNNFPELNVYMPIFTGPNDPIPNYPTENPASYVYAGGYKKTTRKSTILSVSPEFIIIPKELSIKADFSLSPLSYEEQTMTPRLGRVHSSWTTLEYREAGENKAYISRSSTDNYVINVYANYNKTFGKKHDFSALLGVNQERETYGVTTLSLVNLIDPFIPNPTLTEDPKANTQTNTHHALTARAVFGRLLYNYEGKYLFEMDGRYDGSSRFPKDNRFQFFPTFSLGWRLSEESFMAPTRVFLDNLKFRGSWGKLGSQPSTYYPYQSKYGTEEGYFLFNGTRYPVGLIAPGLVSPNLTWEKSTTTNFGVDLTVLGNRLTGTFDIYERKVTDILVPGGKDYPAVLGDEPPFENNGSMSSRGWELLFRWNDRLSNGLSYGIGFSMADSRTKILDNPGNSAKSFADGDLYEGQYMGEIWGYETGGILQKEDFIDGVYYGPQFSTEKGKLYPGLVWYVDRNGDGIISSGTQTVDDPGDLHIIGNTTPRYRYTITGNMSYKGFDLDLMFQGIGKRDVWIDSSSAYWGNGGGSWETYDKSWTPERTDAKFPIHGTTLGGRKQTGYLLDGSYFMLRQAVVGYTLPKALVNKAYLSKVRVYVSGHNLLSFTDIPKYFDPEYVSDSYPPKRTFAFGLQVEF